MYKQFCKRKYAILRIELSMMPRNDVKKYLSRTVLSVSISSVLSVSN